MVRETLVKIAIQSKKMISYVSDFQCQSLNDYEMVT